MRMRTFAAIVVGVAVGVGAQSASAASLLFLGNEYQAQAGANAGTIRGGDPASDQAFVDWLATNSNNAAQISTSLPASASGPVFGTFTDPGAVTSTSVSIGGTSVGVSIVGWDTATFMQTGPSGNAVIDGFGIDGSTLQSGAARPGFASGTGSGAYIGTNNGATSDGILNGVNFDFSAFTGGGVNSFGLFGGDLETGTGIGSGTTGFNNNSPAGFLLLTFSDMTTETIVYAPDASLAADASFSGNNNSSETFGNETGRFVGISTDKLITNALFVVGDDDIDGDADSEQLSFIAPIVFLDAAGAPVIPTAVAVPEPGTLALLSVGLFGGVIRRRRG